MRRTGLPKKLERSFRSSLYFSSAIVLISLRGIGFGKLLQHNLELLRASDSLRPYSVMWGVSRKSMIGDICNQPNTEGRLAGSLAVAAKAYEKKIDMIRVHDVREHVDLFSVLEAMED